MVVFFVLEISLVCKHAVLMPEVSATAGSMPGGVRQRTDVSSMDATSPRMALNSPYATPSRQIHNMPTHALAAWDARHGMAEREREREKCTPEEEEARLGCTLNPALEPLICCVNFRHRPAIWLHVPQGIL